MFKYKCEICDIEFETFSAKANHIRWHHKDNTEYLKKTKEIGVNVNEKRFGKWVHETIICSYPNCTNEIVIKYREGKKREKYFCCRSCANSRGPRSKQVKEKIRNCIKKAWKSGVYDNIDYTSQNKRFSSKTERLIVKYFKDNYPNDEWKSGGRKELFDGIYTARDLYSDKLKICFEYDGIWHFKDICNQLKDKQNKDKALEEWCLKNNYRLIRVSESGFISVCQIEDFIYNNDKQIIKIGDEY